MQPSKRIVVVRGERVGGSTAQAGPPHRGQGAITTAVAATAAANGQLFGFGVVTMMYCLAHATGMRRRCTGRQRYRGEVSHEGEQQQQSGRQAMHAFV